MCRHTSTLNRSRPSSWYDNLSSKPPLECWPISLLCTDPPTSLFVHFPFCFIIDLFWTLVTDNSSVSNRLLDLLYRNRHQSTYPVTINSYIGFQLSNRSRREVSYLMMTVCNKIQLNYRLIKSHSPYERYYMSYPCLRSNKLCFLYPISNRQTGGFRVQL